MDAPEDHPIWRQLKLSLERPYKDENGSPEHTVLDITPDGGYIYEPKENPSGRVAQNLNRIFAERGVDFLEQNNGQLLKDGKLSVSAKPPDAGETDALSDDEDDASNIMTTEELYKMRVEMSEKLYTALGEMEQASHLLGIVLGSSPQLPLMGEPTPSLTVPITRTLAATNITPPPSIIPTQAFNAQLVIGRKDEALRKASSVFKGAADRMEQGRLRSEQYWLDALKLRRANWGLVPAPLPFGSATGKGADRTSKDFLIAYGLETAPAGFRRRAVASMASASDATEPLNFPFRQNMTLRVQLSVTDNNGIISTAIHQTMRSAPSSVEDYVASAQREIVEQEIFSLLVQEASNLPTASTKVSERLIVIEAAQATELKFELVDSDSAVNPLSPQDPTMEAKCDLIYSSLHAFLLRAHRFSALRKGAGSNEPIRSNPQLLQPIIDVLQYEVFCERVKTEVDLVCHALESVGISSTIYFNPVGELGKQLIHGLIDEETTVLAGEAVLRIDDRRTIRLTLASPSSLHAHLPQATLNISSIPQLYQLLTDEAERFLLLRIMELGNERCGGLGGTWFVDLDRCVGRWEGFVVDFRISFGEDANIRCVAFHLDKRNSTQGVQETYSPSLAMDGESSIISWADRIITKILSTTSN